MRPIKSIEKGIFLITSDKCVGSVYCRPKEENGNDAKNVFGV